MSEEQKQACNRIPFETTSSCDRGEVDIYTFSNLPICKVIDPPVPLFGPPTVDFPVIPFTPPPCACINIKTAASGVIEDRESLKFNATFKAEGGDCCEGNYTEKFDIRIPCVPFELIDGNKEIDIDIKTNACGANTNPSGKFNPGIIKNKCQLKINPTLTLNLPTPPVYSFDTRFNIETVCGLTEAEGSFYINPTGDPCSRSLTHNLNLRIPKPKTYSLDASLDLTTSCNLLEATGTFFFTKTDTSCETNYKANLSLNIPKPIKYELEASCAVNKVCYDSGWTGYGDNIFWIESADMGLDCTRKFKAHLDLDIPCIQFELESGSTSHQFEIKEGKPVSGSINLNASIDCCKLKFNPKVTLTMPKIPDIYEYHFDQPEFNLTTYCGTGNATGAFIITNTTGSSGKSITIKPRLDLNIPQAPVTEFTIDPIFITGNHGYSYIGEEFEYQEGNCYRKIIDHITINVPHVANLRICKNAGGTGGNGEFDLGNLPDWNLNDSMFTLSGGIDGFGSFSLGIEEDSQGCVIGMCPHIKLSMPCPLDKLKLKGESSKDSGLRISVASEEASSSGCAAKWKISLKKPDHLYDGTIEVLTGFEFTGNAFNPKIGRLTFEGGLLTDYDGDEEAEINVGFAEHICCN